jgi:hypothetical protein
MTQRLPCLGSPPCSSWPSHFLQHDFAEIVSSGCTAKVQLACAHLMLARGGGEPAKDGFENMGSA